MAASPLRSVRLAGGLQIAERRIIRQRNLRLLVGLRLVALVALRLLLAEQAAERRRHRRQTADDVLPRDRVEAETILERLQHALEIEHVLEQRMTAQQIAVLRGRLEPGRLAVEL